MTVSRGEALDGLVASHDVVFVDFYADWCGPCRMLEPVVERLAQETDTGGCTFVKIFATPGWRITSVCYSHQYDAAVATVDVDANQ